MYARVKYVCFEHFLLNDLLLKTLACRVSKYDSLFRDDPIAVQANAHSKLQLETRVKLTPRILIVDDAQQQTG